MPLVSIYGPDRQNLSSNDRSNGQQMRSNIQDDLMEIDENLEEINRRFHHNEDSMEVEALPQYEQVSGNVSYLIIDTNFFIQNLQFIDDLYNIADQFKLKLVVPNAVIGELDGLKKNEIKGVSARNAIKWIHKSLSEDKDVMRGQRLSESYDRTLHGDDSILDCSLWYQNTYEISLVVLLTNDKNFVTKARINGIKTFEYSDDYSASEVGSIVLQENIYVFGERTDEYRVQRGHQLKSQQPKVQPQSTKDSFRNLEDKLLNIDQTLTSTERLDTIYNEIVTCLREGIHKALVKEYQESLELLQNYNKMGLMTVDECSRTIIRFWQVFGSYFRRNDLLPFREEGKGRNSKKFPINCDEPDDKNVNEFIIFWSAILTTLYDGIMNTDEQELLKILSERWQILANSS